MRLPLVYTLSNETDSTEQHALSRATLCASHQPISDS